MSHRVPDNQDTAARPPERPLSQEPAGAHEAPRADDLPKSAPFMTIDPSKGAEASAPAVPAAPAAASPAETQPAKPQRDQSPQNSEKSSKSPVSSNKPSAQKPARPRGFASRLLRFFGWLFAFCAAFAAAAGLLFWWWTAELAREPAPPLLDGVPFSTAYYSDDGRLLRLSPASDGIFRLKTPLSGIAKEAVIATVFYEDRYFRKHPGVNPFALVRAAFATFTGSRPIGASTITMQVARLRLHLETRSLEGKFRQIEAALRYEAHYSKDEILEAYLNLAPYGGNIEGVGAAARLYFHKDAAALAPGESVGLAVVPQNPVKRRPWQGPDFDQARIRLAKAAVLAGVFPRSLEPALAGPLAVGDPAQNPFEAPHFVRLLETLGAGGKAPDGIVRSTLRLGLQHRLEGVVRRAIARLRPWGIRNAALAVVDVRDKSLLALIGSADFFDDEISGEVSAYRAPRSPGSTLKPFVYGLALDQGLIHAKSILADSPANFAGYAPENADGRFRGPVNATTALVESRNLPAIELARKLRPDLYDLLARAQISLPFDRAHYGLSIVLGGAEVTMADLAGLYASLGSAGIWSPVRVLRDAPGDAPRTVNAAPAPRPLLSPEAAWIVGRMLEARGESIRVREKRFPLIYKTGTSNGFRDAWAAGWVGPYVIVVWSGNFDGRPNGYFQGATLAAPLFREAAAALAADPSLDWPDDYAGPVKKAPKALNVIEESVCRATGDVGNALCRDKTKAWFIPGKSPIRDSGVFREILINKQTGLRACRNEPGQTEKRVWEFWPSHYQRMFLAAGIVKRPPPPFEAGCESFARLEAGASPGEAPVILSPKRGVAYYTGTAGRSRATVVLEAGLSSEARTVYWFDGSVFLGAARGGATLTKAFAPGRHRLTATDDLGRSSAVTLLVRTP